MPYYMCPACGETGHLNVGCVEAWYEEFHPNVPLGSLVPTRCFYCWQELTQGDRVAIRKLKTEATIVVAGEVGTISDILSSKDGSLYLVKLTSGEACYFIRSVLRKVVEDESQPNIVTVSPRG